MTSQSVEGTRIFPSGAGGYFGFQLTGTIEWGQISKPRKIPCRISEPEKSPERKTNLDVLQSQNYAVGIRGHYHVLNSQENPCSNQATQKNTCQILLPKNIPESKISNPVPVT